MKICFRCKIEHNEKYPYCKPCNSKITKKYRKKNLDKMKAYDRQRKFGITPDEYNEMLENQNYVCAICKQKCKSGRNLAVDHCHDTGKIRGLLCICCNRGLGVYKNNISTLENAINYLNRAI